MACSISGGRISPVNENEPGEKCEGLLQKEVDMLRVRLEHRIGGVKLSKCAETYCTFFEQWCEYDAFITLPEPSNPWVNDSTDFWELERQTYVLMHSRHAVEKRLPVAAQFGAIDAEAVSLAMAMACECAALTLSY